MGRRTPATAATAPGMADRVGVSVAKRTCVIDDCDSPSIARGWCRKHYKRWHKHGDPLHVTPWSPPPQNRPRSVGCSVDGCDGKHFANGLCKNHDQQARYRDNLEAAKAYQAEYRAANREARAEYVRAWRAANPERVRELGRRYHQENADKVREQKRRYRDANRDRIRASNTARKALHRGAPVNDLTAEQWAAIKAAYGHRCAYCSTKPKRLTQDHVVPLIRGGHHTASNVVPACQPCNSRKGARAAPIYQPLLM